MHHHWQDFVLAASILGFNIALFPTVSGESKPAIATSLLTVLFQVAALVVFISLALWYSAAMSLMNALLWAILALQKYRQVSDESHSS